MAKSPRTGENRSRRSADRKRPAQSEESVVTPPETSPSTADDRGAIAAAVSRTRLKATREEIARRAYEIYKTRGGTHGYDIEDWLQAERELTSGR